MLIRVRTGGFNMKQSEWANKIVSGQDITETHQYITGEPGKQKQEIEYLNSLLNGVNNDI